MDHVPASSQLENTAYFVNATLVGDEWILWPATSLPAHLQRSLHECLFIFHFQRQLKRHAWDQLPAAQPVQQMLYEIAALAIACRRRPGA